MKAGKRGLVEALREEPLVGSLIAAANKIKDFDIGFEVLEEEIRGILNDVPAKTFKMQGTGSLRDAHEISAAVQAKRDRLISINCELRPVIMKANKIYRQARVYIQQHPDCEGLTAKAFDDVCSLILEEVFDVLEYAKLLLVMTKEQLDNCDSRTSLINSWYVLHKQYTFLTLGKHDLNKKE